MKSPIEVFSNWVADGRDEGMAKGHAKSVDAMLGFALKGVSNSFAFIDAGCGNGWVVQKMGKHDLCQNAIGVDGSESMINKARSTDTNNSYYCSDLMDWIPDHKVDLVHSMEVFYYVKAPFGLIGHIYSNWLNSNGRLIMGVDYYEENKASEGWSTECGISIMTRLSESEWVSGFIKSGFSDVRTWREGSKKDWSGTLVVTGLKK